MQLTTVQSNIKPKTDRLLETIAEYVVKHDITSSLAYETARYCLLDSIGCAILALNYPACTALLGPIIPGTKVPKGARVPGTSFILDPILAAFNIGTLIRWLDYNDTWLAAEWGHPSDNLGAILAVSDYVSQVKKAKGERPYFVKDLLTAMIKAHEIQGILALENSFNRLGYDHVILVKIASTAIATSLLGGSKQEVINALSQAWVDGPTLRTYRHAPNVGSRKSWAAGDATSRAVRLAWLTMQGEKGYPSALTAKTWGFEDVVMKEKPLQLNRNLDAYVMENILFKISFPAEFHAQTAIECAIKLHPLVKNRLNQIDKINLTTHESAIRIISKSGPLYNPADRDHCLQYMVAVALIYGDLKADYYENEFAINPQIDFLRDKMIVEENKSFSMDYLDKNKQSIANSVEIIFKDGTRSEKITVEYPIGHRRRRSEGVPLLFQKFRQNVENHFDVGLTEELVELFNDPMILENMAVDQLMEKIIKTN